MALVAGLRFDISCPHLRLSDVHVRHLPAASPTPWRHVDEPNFYRRSTKVRERLKSNRETCQASGPADSLH